MFAMVKAQYELQDNKLAYISYILQKVHFTNMFCEVRLIYRSTYKYLHFEYKNSFMDP